jgi:hypothetical protein
VAVIIEGSTAAVTKLTIGTTLDLFLFTFSDKNLSL